ncbi:MAG: SprT family zinc-dependent metalloprotease [Casimicrobium sp.]
MGFWSALFSPPTAPQARPKTPRSPRIPRSPRKPVALANADVADVATAIEPRRRSTSGIEFRLERARRKSIGLIITTDGLLIRAPRWTPLYEIDAAITERAAWIAKAIERQTKRRAQLAEHKNGGHVLFRGNKLKVDVRAGLFQSVDLTPAHCVLTTADGDFDADALDEELMRFAKAELPAIAHEMAVAAGLPLKTVTISSARTMWGSCTSDGRVRLNFRLLHLPPELMCHVVAHELAHLVEFNHSKRFWAIVQQLDPNTPKHKRAMKGYSVLLEL